MKKFICALLVLMLAGCGKTTSLVSVTPDPNNLTTAAPRTSPSPIPKVINVSEQPENVPIVAFANGPNTFSDIQSFLGENWQPIEPEAMQSNKMLFSDTTLRYYPPKKATDVLGKTDIDAVIELIENENGKNVLLTIKTPHDIAAESYDESVELFIRTTQTLFGVDLKDLKNDKHVFMDIIDVSMKKSEPICYWYDVQLPESVPGILRLINTYDDSGYSLQFTYFCEQLRN